MGRGKLPLKLIEKERARRITCMKRKTGLMKKAYELSTLCDVRVCLIIHDPAAGDGSGDSSGVKTWPENPDQVERIISDYLSYKAKNPSAKRDLTTADFFNDRMKKLKQKNEKLLKQDRESETRIEEFSMEELLKLLTRLDAKIDDVKRLKTERALMPSSSSYHERSIVVSNNDAFFAPTMPLANVPYYTNLLEGYGSELTVHEGDLIEYYGQSQNIPMAEQFYLPAPTPMMNFGGPSFNHVNGDQSFGAQEDVKKMFFNGVDCGFGKAHGVWF